MYNCYYHPKTEGSNSCKGCKLPVCANCEGELGFCPECMRKRDAVNQLRQLRGAVAQKSKVASTTARLRLAIRQMGPGRPVAGFTPAEAASGRSQMLTRPLPNLDEVRPAAAGPVATPISPAHKPAARRRGTGHGWKYDPDKLAYRAPENLHEVSARRRKKTIKAPKIQGLPQVDAQVSFSAGFLAKIVGFAITAFVGVLIYQFFFHAAPVKPQAKPLYTPLTKEERAMVKATLKEAPAHPRMIDLPDPDAQPAPVSVAPAARSGSVFAQAESVARAVTPVAPVAVYHAPVAAYRAPVAAYRAPAPLYRAPVAPRAYAYAPRAYVAPRPRRMAYQPVAAAPTVQRHSSSLASAMHFSGWGSNPGGGHVSHIEIAHW